MIPFNNNSAAKLIFAQGADNTAMNLKATTAKVNNDSDFKSVFDKTVGSSVKRTVNSDISNDKDYLQNSDQNLKFKSFRDLSVNRSDSSEQNTVKETAGADRAEEVTVSLNKLDGKKDEYDTQVNVLAMMLGISPSELVKLANELGFSTEDLKNSKQVEQLMQKLGNLLQLDDSQKEILVKLAQEVTTQVNSVDSKTEEKVPEQAIKLSSENKSVEDSAVKFDLSRISSEIKNKISQLLQNGQADSEAIKSEVSKVIAAMKAQAQSKVTANQEQDTVIPETTGVQENQTEFATKPVEVKPEDKEAIKVKDTETENSEEVQQNRSDLKSEVKSVSVQVSTDSNQNDQQPLQTLADMKLNMINNQNTVTKSVFSMPQPVKTSEIINQVVEQAKVVLGQDKTEMVIQLKPDHLGKLELKVVTEQGIVAAKFIAENQQVKEVIETNMQLLKDSLQKQGIAINGVSVQVGQDKKSDYQQQSSYESKNNGSSNRTRYGSGVSGGSGVRANIMETLPERLAQYSYETNTINLTA